MQNLSAWLAEAREEILTRRAAIADLMPRLEPLGWELLGLGGYFAYMRHPFELSSADLARDLVRDAGVLCLPGTMFQPEGHARGESQLRIAFANLDAAGLKVLFDRLAALPRNA